MDCGFSDEGNGIKALINETFLSQSVDHFKVLLLNIGVCIKMLNSYAINVMFVSEIHRSLI